MEFLDAVAVARALPPRALVDALSALFADPDVTVPTRHHHTLPARDGERPGTLLLMPAWQGGGQGYMGVKVAAVFPDNPAQRDQPAVNAQVLLMEGGSGRPLALLDGPELTRRRTAAASALAADRLARPDAKVLLMVGTGALAPHFIRHHAAVREYHRVLVWGRDPNKAAAVSDAIAPELPRAAVSPVATLAEGLAVADVVSCVTSASLPVVPGAALRPGQHLDLAGGFTPAMRETDDEAIRRARVFIDTPAALEECGDLCDPLASGALTREAIQGDLAHLCRGERPGRTGPEEITLFKSVGAALEDLAAAILAWDVHTERLGAG